MRILVTGSRSISRGVVHDALPDYVTEPSVDVVVHGACTTGGDHHTDEWCKANHVAREQHPADWQAHGKAAGFIRNQEMVDLGADYCLAFWDGESRGTLDCIRRAVKAGIPVRIVPAVQKGAPA